MQHSLTLKHFTNLISKVENDFNIDCDDWNIETFFAFDDIPAGVLILPNHDTLLFTDSPYTAAASVFEIELNDEGRGITWDYVLLPRVEEKF